MKESNELLTIKKYKKGREQSQIKLRQIQKASKNLQENFQITKQNMINYLNNVEELLQDRLQEIEQKVNQYKSEIIIPELEQIQLLSNQEEQEIQLNSEQKAFINNISGLNKNISGDFQGKQQKQQEEFKEYIYQANQNILKINQNAQNDEYAIVEQLRHIQDIKYTKLLKKLKDKNYLKSQEIEEIMFKVDRKDFTQNAYEDSAQSIGFNTTISAPHMHAFTLELIKNYSKTAVKSLDIGIGSGWMSVALSELMENKQSICYGIDHLQGVLNIAKKNILKNHRDKLENGKIVLCKGDGRQGLGDFAPFDIIHMGAAGSMKAVNKFIHQLAPGGVLLGPIIIGKGGYNQEFMVIKKNMNGEISKESIIHVAYGALQKQSKQYEQQDEEEYFENEDDHITVEHQNIKIEQGQSDNSEDEQGSGQENNQISFENDQISISLLQRLNQYFNFPIRSIVFGNGERSGLNQNREENNNEDRNLFDYNGSQEENNYLEGNDLIEENNDEEENNQSERNNNDRENNNNLEENNEENQ